MAKNVIRILKNSKCKVNQFEEVPSDLFFVRRKSELITIFNYSVAVLRIFVDATRNICNDNYLTTRIIEFATFFYIMLNNYSILFDI